MGFIAAALVQYNPAMVPHIINNIVALIAICKFAFGSKNRSEGQWLKKALTPQLPRQVQNILLQWLLRLPP